MPERPTSLFLTAEDIHAQLRENFERFNQRLRSLAGPEEEEITEEEQLPDNDLSEEVLPDDITVKMVIVAGNEPHMD